MAKNTIQFQKGLSLPLFLSNYGTDKQCETALFKFRWPQGFVCPECGHKKHCEIKSRKVYQCHRCHQQTSLTSGTIFAFTKLPLSLWFLGIYLITQSKHGVSSLHLSRSLGTSYNAALRMKHKLQQVMKERDDEQPLEGWVQMDDAYWGGERHGGKRGRGSEGKLPFVAAVSTNEEGHPIGMRMSQISSFSLKEVGKWACKHLSASCSVVSDGLNCFPGVKAAGCSHEGIVTGGGYKSVEKEEFYWVNTMIGNVKNSIRGTYHAISPTHFPRYLAEFCYRFNRRFELGAMIERLAYVAVRTPPMPQRLLSMAEALW